jgi:transposase InsO family protein
MKAIYQMLGESRQNVSQCLQRAFTKTLASNQVVDLAKDIRKEHGKMGCRKMYWKAFVDLPIGRDQCEQILLSNGFRVEYPRNYQRTTYSIGKHYYPNRIEGLTLDGINQVWQTDITYFEVGSRFYYLVFIVDVYSRRIVGWSVDDSLWAQANLRALEKAIRLRGDRQLKGLIHHSDRGGQYIDRDYISRLTQQQITPSMCQFGWQNAYSERVNGIIKNEYLNCWKISDFVQLKKAVNRAIYLYNVERPHWKLHKKLSPVAFEKQLSDGLFRIKPTMKLYSDKINT